MAGVGRGPGEPPLLACGGWPRPTPSDRHSILNRMQTVEKPHATHLRPLPTPDPPAPDRCARCGHDDLDDDLFCHLCGAVTVNTTRFVVSYGPAE